MYAKNFLRKLPIFLKQQHNLLQSEENEKIYFETKLFTVYIVGNGGLSGAKWWKNRTY